MTAVSRRPTTACKPVQRSRNVKSGVAHSRVTFPLACRCQCSGPAQGTVFSPLSPWPVSPELSACCWRCWSSRPWHYRGLPEERWVPRQERSLENVLLYLREGAARGPQETNVREMTAIAMEIRNVAHGNAAFRNVGILSWSNNGTGPYPRSSVLWFCHTGVEAAASALVTRNVTGLLLLHLHGAA